MLLPTRLPTPTQRTAANGRRKSAAEGEKGRRETTTEPSEAEGLPEVIEPFVLGAVTNKV